MTFLPLMNTIPNMAVTKNEYPILEYDPNPIALLMPDRKGLARLPRKCVFSFFDIIAEYAAITNAVKVSEFDTCAKLFPIYLTAINGLEICFCQAPLGASAATQFLDYLISYGVTEIIACGACGTLIDLPENEIVIPVEALRDEGTSYHYLPPRRTVKINNIATSAIRKVASDFGIPNRDCMTWTTDGFYRETDAMVEYRRNEGCQVVEMECAALAACSEFRNATFGQVLYTADTLVGADGHDDRGWGISSGKRAFELAVEAVSCIDS
jgi:uridine phosphorylase